MFDALVYGYVMLNFKHGGHVLVAAALIRTLDAHYRALRAALVGLWRRPMPRRQQSVSLCSPIEAWSQSLNRLETYVASMA